MLIVDRHSSIIMGPFLDYVNDPTHRWSGVIGIPYGTHLWQVGDYAEMMMKLKQWLRQQKAAFSLKQTIKKHAIMILLTLACK
jgi:hypothetical protein